MGELSEVGEVGEDCGEFAGEAGVDAQLRMITAGDVQKAQTAPGEMTELAGALGGIREADDGGVVVVPGEHEEGGIKGARRGVGCAAR